MKKGTPGHYGPDDDNLSDDHDVLPSEIRSNRNNDALVKTDASQSAGKRRRSPDMLYPSLWRPLAWWLRLSVLYALDLVL